MEFYHLNLSLIVILYFTSVFFLDVDCHFVEEHHTHHRVKRNHASDRQNQASNALKNVNPAGLVSPVSQIPSTIVKILPRNRNQQHKTLQNEPASKRRAPPLMQNKIPIQINRHLKNSINLNDTDNAVKNDEFTTKSDDFNSTNKNDDVLLGGNPEIHGLRSLKTYNISRNSPGKPSFHMLSIYENDDLTEKPNLNDKSVKLNQSKYIEKISQPVEEDVDKQHKVLSSDNVKKISESQDNITFINNTNVSAEIKLSSVENVVVNEETNEATNNKSNGNKNILTNYRNSETAEGSYKEFVIPTASPKTEYVIKKEPVLKKQTKNKIKKKTKIDGENKVSDTSITESLNIIRELIEKLKSPNVATSILSTDQTCGIPTAEVLTDLNEEEENYESDVAYSDKFNYEDTGKMPLNTEEQVYPVQSDTYYSHPYDSYSKNSQYNTYCSPNWSYHVQPVDCHQSLTTAGKYQNFGQRYDKDGLKQAYYVLNVKPKNTPKIRTYGEVEVRNPQQLIKNKDFDAILRSRTDTELIIKGKTVEPSRMGARNQCANDKKAINVAPSTLNQNQGLININGLYRNQNIPTYICLK